MRWVLALALAGCSVPDLDLEGRSCPCAAGWTCDARNVCVRSAMPDAGVDAAIDAPDTGTPAASACDVAHAARVFCDGFESGPSFVGWNGESVEGTSAFVDLIDVGTHLGSGSLRTRTSLESERAYLNKEGLGPYTSGSVYLRAYMYVSSSPALDHVVTMFLTGGTDGASLEVYADGTMEIYLQGPDVGVPANVPIPFDEWVCVELALTIGTSGTVALSSGGVERARMTGLDTTAAGGYNGFTVGLNWTDATNTLGATVLYDEVVFDTAPIGCD